ncbi:MAG: hypothetical protein ABIC91_03945 [Nanoarchaeota archaeon]|nr:hypothetical protein [Nanoarchaeota archaeon]MBU1030262.1 hypothetical protein [Nanoarchaeota archaeon]MBU1850719.1 hypothetical protein [Nanoarchaeota archaeon]
MKRILERMVMVDGPDCAGKGVVVEGLSEWVKLQGQSVFDVREFMKKYKVYPEFSDFESFDALLTCEPTYAWTGLGLRDEMMAQNGRPYSAREIAEALSIDRAILYRRLLAPATLFNKWVFQERGNITSFVYQPIHAKVDGENLSLRKIKSLPGNKLTLNSYPPGLLLIAICSAETAMKRKSSREKQDNCIYETKEYQELFINRYESRWLRRMYESRGTVVKYINTDNPSTEEDTKEKAVLAFKDYSLK